MIKAKGMQEFVWGYGNLMVLKNGDRIRYDRVRFAIQPNIFVVLVKIPAQFVKTKHLVAIVVIVLLFLALVGRDDPGALIFVELFLQCLIQRRLAVIV